MKQSTQDRRATLPARRIMAMLLAASLAFGCALCGAAPIAGAAEVGISGEIPLWRPIVPISAAVYEGPGAATAEDAVRLYFQGVREENLSKMLSAFAVETYAANYSLEAYLERMGAYLPSMTTQLPQTNPLFDAINVETRKAEIVGRISYQLLAIDMPDLDLTKTTAFPRAEGQTPIADFLALFEKNTRRLSLSSCLVIGFFPAWLFPEQYGSELNQKNMDRQRKIVGADEMGSTVACVIARGRLYVFCCDTVRYGDRWYILNFGGNIGSLLGISLQTGGMVPVW